MEEVDTQGSANGKELLGVDGGFMEEILEGSRGDADLISELLVGVALATEFVTDKVAYVYLHSGAICALGYLIHYSDDRR